MVPRSTACGSWPRERRADLAVYLTVWVTEGQHLALFKGKDEKRLGSMFVAAGFLLFE